nr:DUF1932 domain-containing protein [uncultured Dethiosulfovibrio sp.]
MKIGFIGFGEAAYNISIGLNGEGISEIRAYDAMADDETMGKLIRHRAQEAKVEMLKTAREIAEWADLVFVAVPSSFAMDVCDQIREALTPGKLYIDVSASTPSVKERIWDAIKDSGVFFVDAAMLGSLPKDKHEVPITASGNGAEKFHEMMTPYGMKITLAGEKAGAASAIKLVRSIFMKGIAALMIEMLQGADAYGVSDQVVSSISKSMDGTDFKSHLNRLVTGTAIHCHRRGAELKGSIAMLEESSINADMTEATKHRLENMEQFKFAERFIDNAPKGWQEIIEIMRENRRDK